MREKTKRYLLGTINEIATELYNPNEENFEDRFAECDFAIVDEYNFDIKKEDLEFIYNKSTGWYGIKKLNAGFDNSHDDNVDLFVDYYGGGCGTYRAIGMWDNKEEIINIIKEMIIESLSIQEANVTKYNTILVCEIK